MQAQFTGSTWRRISKISILNETLVDRVAKLSLLVEVAVLDTSKRDMIETEFKEILRPQNTFEILWKLVESSSIGPNWRATQLCKLS